MSPDSTCCGCSPRASTPGPSPIAAPEVTGSPGRWEGSLKGTTLSAAGLDAGPCGAACGVGDCARGAPRWSPTYVAFSPYLASGRSISFWAGPPSVRFDSAPGPEAGAGLFGAGIVVLQ